MFAASFRFSTSAQADLSAGAGDRGPVVVRSIVPPGIAHGTACLEQFLFFLLNGNPKVTSTFDGNPKVTSTFGES